MRHETNRRRSDESWFRPRSRAFTVMLVSAALVGTLAACGSGAVEGPDDEAASEDGGGGNSGSGGGNGGGSSKGGNGGGNGGSGGGNSGGGSSKGGNGGGSGGGDEFSWSLPGGDLSTDQIGEAFNRLQAGKCTRGEVENDGESAEEWLDFQEPRPEPTDVRRWIFMQPGQEELYEAAIAACKGDLDNAQTHLEMASVGTHPGDCRLYKAIRSVLEQRPQGSVECPDPPGEPGSSSTESTTSTGSDDSTTESTTSTQSDDSTTESKTSIESDESSTESTASSTSSQASTNTNGGRSTSNVGGGPDTAG
jgi:hypothetical protein